MKKCPFCAEEIQDQAIKCRHCGEMFLQVAPGTSVVEGPDGTTYRIAENADGARVWVVNTHKGFIDFTGAKTGVFLPDAVKRRLEAKGIGPQTRFLSRAAAHRALKEAGWTSASGKRVGPSAFFEEQDEPGPGGRDR